jgi:hypothetical protein
MIISGVRLPRRNRGPSRRPAVALAIACLRSVNPANEEVTGRFRLLQGFVSGIDYMPGK